MGGEQRLWKRHVKIPAILHFLGVGWETNKIWSDQISRNSPFLRGVGEGGDTRKSESDFAKFPGILHFLGGGGGRGEVGRV